MALFLVQHGKSLSKEVDPEQGLSEEGKVETEKIAALAKGYGVRVGSIMQSGKKRAAQTAEIFASALQPQGGIQEQIGLKPLDDVAVFADKITEAEDLMLVGHLPFMERLASYLVTGSVEKPVISFQNSGIVCLDMDVESGVWTIRWTLLPRIG